MSVKVVINGIDCSAIQISNVKIDKNDSYLGRISSNEADIIFDNTSENFIITPENEIKLLIGTNEIILTYGIPASIDIDNIRQFTGYLAKEPALSVDKKSVTMKLVDRWKLFEKKYCEDKIYLNTDFITVLKDLVQQGGEILENCEFENPDLNIDFWQVNKEIQIKDAIEEVIKSVGGKLYYNEIGKLIFKAGFASIFDSSVQATFTISNIDKLELKHGSEKVDQVEVKTKKKILKDEKEYIYIGATEDNPIVVPAEGLPSSNDDSFIAQFEKDVWWVEGYSDVEFDADSGISMDEVKYNDNFLDLTTNLPKNISQMKLKFNNSSGLEGNVTDLKIEGKPIIEEDLICFYPTVLTNNKEEISNDFVSNNSWGTQLAKYMYEELQFRQKTEFNIIDFSQGLNLGVGNKVLINDSATGLSHRFVIRGVKIDYKNAKITLDLQQDRSSFVSTIPTETKINIGIPLQEFFDDRRDKKLEEHSQQISEISDTISYIDGVIPSIPTNIILSTTLIGGESYITVSFEQNPELDIIGYEIAYSYDNNWWESIMTVEPLVNIKVTANTIVYVKVRAYDVEGYKSPWSTIKTITSTKDTIPPAIPVNFVATGLFQKVKLDWDKNIEPDFKEYHIQVSSTEDFANILNEYYLNANYMVYSGQTNTTYYFRLSAIDTSSNESDWSYIVSATTAAVYDEDIESQIIEEMGNNLDTLNNETLPGLQDDLSMLEDISALEIPASFTMLFTTSLQDDISGVTPEGYEPVIRNGDFINTNLNRMISVHETRITQTENDITLMAFDIDGLETNFSQLQVTVNGINSTVISQGETLDNHGSQIQQLSNQISFAVAAFDENGNPVSGSSLILTADGKIKATADKFILYGDALVNGSITALKLGANSVTANAIGTNQIITNVANIKNGVIETAHIKDAAISTAKIANAAITNVKIGTAAVDTANIADLAVTNAKIANLDAAKITTGYLNADRIASGTITADKIASNFTISAGQYIQAGDETRNYKLDGIQGLIRGIYGTNYNIPVVIKHGIVNFDGFHPYMVLDISEFHLTNFYVLLNKVNNRMDYVADNSYDHLYWQKSGNDLIYIYYSYFNENSYVNANQNEVTMGLPTTRGVWSSWGDLGTENDAEVLTITLTYYMGAQVVENRNVRYFNPGGSYFHPFIRHRKAPTINAIETEINWGADGHEIIELTTFSTDPTNKTAVKARLYQKASLNTFYGRANIEYTIIGY